MKFHFSFFQSIALTGLLLFSFACKKTIAPEAPDTAAIKKEYKKELSSINLPMNIQVAELQKTVNDQLKGVIYEDMSFDNNDGDNLKIKVSKKGTIKLSASGNTVFYSVPLKIWLDYRQEIGALSMHAPALTEVILSFKSEIDLNKKWEVTTKSTATGFKWIKQPVVILAGSPVNVGGIVAKILDEELQGVADLMDDLVKDYNTRKMMKEMWVEIQKPMLVSEDYQSWLKIEPKSVSMAPIRGNKKEILINIGMKGFLEVRMGTEPDYKINPKLPDLVKTKKNPDTFNMTIATEITFDKATELLKENLVGYTYEYGKKKKIEVTDCAVFGVGDELGVRVDFDGNIKGQFYMKGTPMYDSTTSEIYMDNFNWDIKSKKLILKAADWLLHGPIKKKIEGYMRYPMDSTITEYTELAEQSLNDNPITDNLHLKCDIEKVYPTDILMTTDAIRAYLFIQGRAKLKYGKQ